MILEGFQSADKRFLICGNVILDVDAGEDLRTTGFSGTRGWAWHPSGNIVIGGEYYGHLERFQIFE